MPAPQESQDARLERCEAELVELRRALAEARALAQAAPPATELAVAAAPATTRARARSHSPQRNSLAAIALAEHSVALRAPLLPLLVPLLVPSLELAALPAGGLSLEDVLCACAADAVMVLPQAPHVLLPVLVPVLSHSLSALIGAADQTPVLLPLLLPVVSPVARSNTPPRRVVPILLALPPALVPVLAPLITPLLGGAACALPVLVPLLYASPVLRPITLAPFLHSRKRATPVIEAAPGDRAPMTARIRPAPRAAAARRRGAALLLAAARGAGVCRCVGLQRAHALDGCQLRARPVGNLADPEHALWLHGQLRGGARRRCAQIRGRCAHRGVAARGWRQRRRRGARRRRVRARTRWSA